MKNKAMRLEGPISVDMQVMIINEKTGQVGEVTIGMGRFKFPDEADLRRKLKEFSDNELEQHAPGFRVMTKREAWDQWCLKKAGEVLAMPGGPDWDRPGSERGSNG